MTFQPGPALLVGILAVLYIRATRLLAGRGQGAARGQLAFFWLGWALLAAAFFSPLDEQAPRSVGAHMAQHVLMADIAVPLLLLGLRNPVLQWMLPPALMVPLARNKALRRLGARLRSPLVAIGVYTLVLYGWHMTPAFEGALRNDFVHGLQHESFIAASVLLWWPLIEPARRRMRGELWKVGYLVGARIPSMFLGMAFVFAGSPLYTGWYGHGDRAGGLSPAQDQRLGGGVMTLVDIVLTFVALSLLFWRASAAQPRSADTST